jgi:hypothetical protein
MDADIRISAERLPYGRVTRGLDGILPAARQTVTFADREHDGLSGLCPAILELAILLRVSKPRAVHLVAIGEE